MLEMTVIGTPFGEVLKFGDLDALRKVIAELQNMEKWAQEVWDEEPDYPVKLAYIIKPDNLSPEDKEWLDNFTDSLPNARR